MALGFERTLGRVLIVSSVCRVAGKGFNGVKRKEELPEVALKRT
jgi:hypothetical protein